MVFNSLTFIVFFVVARVLYGLARSWTAQKTILLLGSYLFYAAWNPPFVLLIILSTVIDFVVARAMHRSSDPVLRKRLLWLSVGTNLGLLSYFKYSPLAMSTLQEAMSALGIAYAPPAWNVILPVGISFYTFQTLSYTIDVYRGKLTPTDSLLDFAVFVTFFPQLVAGPIVRAVDFMPQLATPRTSTRDQFFWGLNLITVGLFQKVVLGDGLLAPVVRRTYDAWSMVGAEEAFLGTLAFTGQIFCDFAGYSTIAIGVALCFGFVLPDNFHFPYGARGFSDFWRRWHISLSSWLRDYLYISLGGNRQGPTRTQINLMLTMLLGGLWHGASWRFVAWGALHGLYLMIERVLMMAFEKKPWWHTVPAQAVGWAMTLLATMLAWVFFRAESFEAAFTLIGSMVTLSPGTLDVVNAVSTVTVLVVGGGIIGWHLLFRNMRLESIADATPRVLQPVAVGAMLFAVYMAPGNSEAFIYFQF